MFRFDPWSDDKSNDVHPFRNSKKRGSIVNELLDMLGLGGNGGDGDDPGNMDFQSKNLKVSPVLIFSILFVLLLIWGSTGIYSVQPEEQGVELFFGVHRRTTDPGLHYNFPYPIGHTIKAPFSTVHKEILDGRISQESDGNQVLVLTGDENIVDISMDILWKIRDSYLYLFKMYDAKGMNHTVRNAAESAMRGVVGKSKIMSIMEGEGRMSVAEDVKSNLASILDEYCSCIDIVSVQLKKVDPPARVIDAFRDVQSARADRERTINMGYSYKNDILPKARGEAERLVRNAEAYSSEAVAQATGDASRFMSVYEQYKESPSIVRERIYIDAMSDILTKVDKIVIDNKVGSSVVQYLPLNDLLKHKSVDKNE